MRPTLTKRDQVLVALRGGPKTAKDLQALGIPCARVHIESLVFEDGIAIECHSGLLEDAPDGGCRSSVPAFVLVRDDWADSPSPIPEFAGGC